MPSFILEIAVFNLASALLAAEAGAGRIELCENSTEGGVTPSYGTLKTVIEKTAVPVFPMIRPRGGDFLYDENELAAMEKDTRLCRELGFTGIVTGALLANGSIHREATARLVELAYPMEVTFHRAFDRAREPLQAMEDLIGCGCSRILTSGQSHSVTEGKELIRQLVLQASGRIIILPGCGVRSNNIREIASFTGATELHSSARKSLDSGMDYIQKTTGENLSSVSVDTEEIRKMKKALD